MLAPVVLGAVWLQGVALDLLLLAGAAVMGWEWARLSGRGGFGPAGFLILGSEVAAVLAMALGAPGWALLLALLASAAVLAVGKAAEPVWAAGGTLWIAAGAIAFLWLAGDPLTGRGTALWLLALVWANDTAAYVAGRLIGGPKLASRISPNKTWAGFGGGVLGAGAIGWAAALIGGARPEIVAPASLLLAAAAQLGDLAESAAKRHFGVKDSSQLIPGHGGLLDRVDGLLAAAALAGLITVAAGASPFAWR